MGNHIFYEKIKVDVEILCSTDGRECEPYRLSDLRDKLSESNLVKELREHWEKVQCNTYQIQTIHSWIF